MALPSGGGSSAGSPSVWVPCGWCPPLSCSCFPWHLFLVLPLARAHALAVFHVVSCQTLTPTPSCFPASAACHRARSYPASARCWSCPRSILFVSRRFVCKHINRSHTHTDREQHPRHRHTHTHDKNNTPNPKRTPPTNTQQRRWRDDGACHLPARVGGRAEVSVGGRVLTLTPTPSSSPSPAHAMERVLTRRSTLLVLPRVCSFRFISFCVNPNSYPCTWLRVNPKPSAPA